LKLIIQIPCYNEAETLPDTIAALPRQLVGFDEVEILVVDDGSSDGTADIARELAVDHVISLPDHAGLATAFITGIDSGLKYGADIIVNTDADNQYQAEDIKHLIAPILAGEAEMVVGDRGVAESSEFSPLKRRLQVIGSWLIGHASGIETPDAASGFRAYTRNAAMRIIVLSKYSYTLETLIQAGANNIAVKYVPVRTNPQTRPSRLMKSIPHYLVNSGTTILRAYTMYRPLRVFTMVGLVLILGALILGIRFLYFFIIGQGSGNIQSLILAAILSIIGFQVFLIGLLADLVGFNRAILEDILYRVRRMELDRFSTPEENSPPTDESD
jgi:glycosyltransferase involved in cell wall biosynthesis